MQIALISQSFRKDSGQGIEKYCGYLLEKIPRKQNIVNKIKLRESKNPLVILFESFLGSVAKILGEKANVYHFTTTEMAFACVLKRPSVVTVYDLIPYILKNERKRSYNLYFKIVMNFVKRANHLIVISESTKEDLIKYLKVPENKISLVYMGVDHNLYYPIKHKKNKNFTVGFLGGLVKRKNARILLEVAEILKGENIVFKIGGKGQGFVELKKQKEKRNLKNVEFLGFIPDDELNQFYNSLDLFIVPAIYDGFSMPGLEAMACGCPIIVSNTSALPEVAGNAGITVNPFDSNDIASKILNIKNSPKLVSDMKRKSLQHSKKFTWEKCAAKTFDVYKKVTKNKVEQII